MNTAYLILIALVGAAVLIVAAANYAIKAWPLLFPSWAGYPRRDEDVQFTVYKPSVVEVGVWHKLVAFAHLSKAPEGTGPAEKEPAAEVRERAAASFQNTASGIAARTVDARRAVPRGVVRFRLTFDGIELAQKERRFVWKGDVHQEEFEFKAPPETEGKVAHGQLRVYAGWVLLAVIDLSIQVNSSLARSGASPEQVTAPPYRKVFVSYARADRDVVEQVVGYSKAAGDDFIRDVTHLKSGEEWDPRLLELIREADVFQLFWSSHSMTSEFVRREWEYALSLRRANFIRPNYWEDPFPEDKKLGLPPEELRALNFYRLPLAEGPLARAVGWARPAHALGSLVIVVSVVMNVLVLSERGIIIDPALRRDLQLTPTPQVSPTPITTPSPTHLPTPEASPSTTPVVHPSTPPVTPTPITRPTPQPSPLVTPTQMPTPLPTPTPETPLLPRKFGELESNVFDQAGSRLDDFAIELQKEPTSTGYLICYGGRGARQDEAQRRCDRAKGYLVNIRGMDASRIVTKDGGYKDHLTVELWMVPSGAQPPHPRPDFNPGGLNPMPTPPRSRLHIEHPGKIVHP